MGFPLKQVRTLQERLRISEEVQKNPLEKRPTLAKRLCLPPSTLNTIIAKEKIRKHSYMSVDKSSPRVVSLEVEIVWRRCKVVVVVVVVVMTMKPSFTEALRAFESMRPLMYAHDITERDQANIITIESLLLNLKWKGSTKRMKINDFLKKK
jgi:hypothetical protein